MARPFNNMYIVDSDRTWPIWHIYKAWVIQNNLSIRILFNVIMVGTLTWNIKTLLVFFFQLSVLFTKPFQWDWDGCNKTTGYCSKRSPIPDPTAVHIVCLMLSIKSVFSPFQSFIYYFLFILNILNGSIGFWNRCTANS